MDSNVIIMGGGLGGLFCGAFLAKEGVKVCVVEKNDTVGGGLQSYRRFGSVFDTGMHVIGGMQPGGNVRRMCDYLGIWDEVKVKDVDPMHTDEIYYACEDKTYVLAKGKDAYVQALSKEFPDQKENLERYVDAVFALADEIELFNLKPGASGYLKEYSEDFSISASGFIAKYISDKRLRSIVAYLNALYGGSGLTTPAYVHAVMSALYIKGASRFAGSSSLFAETLADFIRRNGGEVISGDGVAKIITDKRHITEIITSKGLHLNADRYISDIHPCTLFTLFADPSALTKAYRDRLNAMPNTYSAFTLNIKLKSESFRYMNYSGFYLSDYDDIWDLCSCEKEWPRGFLYMTPPDLQQGEWATRLSITAPMTWETVKKWEDTTVGRRGEEYLQWKRSCADKLLSMMESRYPGFRDCIEAMDISSPLTIRDYYGVKEGAMSGFKKDYSNMMESMLPVFTKVDNLLLTGQNCNLHGFCGVPLTAINTCEAILGKNYLIDKLNGK